MKNKFSIIIILFFSFVVLGLIFITSKQLASITSLNLELKSAADISMRAKEINIASYKYHMELLEYVYNPSSDRLSQFLEARQDINNQINEFDSKISQSNTQIYSSGKDFISNVFSNLQPLKSSTDQVLSDVKNVESLKQDKASKEDIELAQQKLKESIASCELQFDNFAIDEKVEEFAYNQSSFTYQKGIKLIDLGNRAQIYIMLLAVNYLVLLVTIVIWLERIIAKTTKR